MNIDLDALRAGLQQMMMFTNRSDDNFEGRLLQFVVRSQVEAYNYGVKEGKREAQANATP